MPADAVWVTVASRWRAAIEDVVRQHTAFGHQPAEDDAEQVLERGPGRRWPPVGGGCLEPVSHVTVELLLQR